MTNIELHYGTGGHGGPYRDIQEAVNRSKQLLEGNRNERTIEIRKGVNGELLGTVRKVAPDGTGYQIEVTYNF